MKRLNFITLLVFTLKSNSRQINKNILLLNQIEGMKKHTIILPKYLFNYMSK